MLCAQKNWFRNRVEVGQFKKYDIRIMLGLGSELGGVRVWRAGSFFIHILELRFKRQIFMIFIVDYIYQKGFLKIENLKFVENPFRSGQKIVLKNLGKTLLYTGWSKEKFMIESVAYIKSLIDKKNCHILFLNL